jgi:hypothetical protein
LPARAVARVPSLGDDALEFKLAGVTIDGITVVRFEMLDVDDFRRRLFQDALQCTFALD